MYEIVYRLRNVREWFYSVLPRRIFSGIRKSRAEISNREIYAPYPKITLLSSLFNALGNATRSHTRLLVSSTTNYFYIIRTYSYEDGRAYPAWNGTVRIRLYFNELILNMRPVRQYVSYTSVRIIYTRH